MKPSSSSNPGARLSDDERLGELQRRLGRPLSRRAEARAALTHMSYVNEHRDEGREDNERLEFLGDAVLDVAISHRLMERLPLAREGELSRLRASIVDEEGLASIARSIGLGDLLLLGRGEELSGGRDKSSLLADALEAVIGAVYLCGGLAEVLAIVDRLFGEVLERAGQGAPGRDYKSTLQELTQTRFKSSPHYRIVAEQGPPHAKVFSVEVELEARTLGKGEGRNKKDAEQAAAREALERLGQEGVAGAPIQPPRPAPGPSPACDRERDRARGRAR